MGELVVIYGLSGAGKTTVAGKLEGRFGDKCRRLCTRRYEDSDRTGGRGTPGFARAKREAYRNLLERTEEQLEKEQLVVVEGTFTDIDGGPSGAKRLREYVELAEQGDYHSLFVEVSCGDDEEVERRLRERKAEKPDSRGSVAGYRYLKGRYNIDFEPPNYVHLDNSGTLEDLGELLETGVYPRIETNSPSYGGDPGQPQAHQQAKAPNA